MKLTKIRIEKFRAIREAEICVGTELALVGQNSSGKSSVLRALNAFFNYLPLSTTKQHQTPNSPHSPSAVR